MKPTLSREFVRLGVQIVQVAAGDAHSLFLSGNGQIYAAGNGYHGALGLGKQRRFTQERQLEHVPTLLESVASIPFVGVRAGAQHSVGVSATGSVYSWGRGRRGQLGFPDLAVDKIEQPRRLNFFKSMTIVDADCGSNFTAFLTLEGELYACGGNSFGQLGLGFTSEAVFMPGRVHLQPPGQLLEPEQQPWLPKTGRKKPRRSSAWIRRRRGMVVRISCGQTHMLALDGEGTAYSWGKADFGALAQDGVVEGCVPNPQKAGMLPKGRRVIGVAAGSSVSAFILEPELQPLESDEEQSMDMEGRIVKVLGRRPPPSQGQEIEDSKAAGGAGAGEGKETETEEAEEEAATPLLMSSSSEEQEHHRMSGKSFREMVDFPRPVLLSYFRNAEFQKYLSDGK